MLKELPKQLRATEVQSARRAREIGALKARNLALSEMVSPLREEASSRTAEAEATKGRHYCHYSRFNNYCGSCSYYYGCCCCCYYY